MIFIDTSAFYAMEVQVDINHEDALKVKTDIAKNRYGTPITSNYIINETLTLLRFKAGHQEAVAFKDKIDGSKSIKIIRIEESTDNSAWNIFKKHQDKELSIVDCTSFVIMKELGIKTGFAFDQHFAQMKFKVVPNENL